MLNILLYQRAADLFSLNFLASNSTTTSNSKAINVKSVLVIAPNPEVADALRKSITTKENQEVEVLTMAKFIQLELTKLYGREYLQKNFKNKEELFLLYGNVWKKFFPERSFENYAHAYQLFTELRSFTLDITVMEEILAEHDQVLQKGIWCFNKIALEMGIIDEQKAYSLVGEGRSSIRSDKRVLIFWDFVYMSGIQVDMLRNLSRVDEVIVPFPERAYNILRSFDWIKWLAGVAVDGKPTKLLNLKDLESLEKIENLKNKTGDQPDFESGAKESAEVATIPFVKYGLGRAIQNFLDSGLVDQGRTTDIIIGTNNLQINYIGELPLGDIFFKSPVEIFSEKVAWFYKQLDAYLLKNKLSNGQLPFDKLISFLEELILESQDLRIFKVLSLFYQVLNSWRELSDQNSVLGTFDLKLLKQVVHLNIPRIFSVPLASLSPLNSGSVLDFTKLANYSLKNTTLVCISSGHELGIGGKGSAGFGGGSVEEKVRSKLATIGPIMREELAGALLKERLSEILTSNNTFLFLEDGILLENATIYELLSGLNLNTSSVLKKMLENTSKKDSKLSLNTVSRTLPISTNKISSRLKREMVKKGRVISATRLQCYYDCPRKYYLRYIEKVEPEIEIKNSITPREIGKLQHQIIGDYCTQYDKWNEDWHHKLCLKLLTGQVKEKKLLLDQLDLKLAYSELRRYTAETINYLLNLKKEDPTLNFFFEYKLPLKKVEGFRIQGSVDLLIKSSERGYAVLDFKRSYLSIPSKKALFNYQNLQIWFYLNHLFEKENYFLWGFLNLKHGKRSLLFKEKDFPFLELQSKIMKYKEREMYWVNKLRMEEDYPVAPRVLSVCDSCFIKNICWRS